MSISTINVDITDVYLTDGNGTPTGILDGDRTVGGTTTAVLVPSNCRHRRAGEGQWGWKEGICRPMSSKINCIRGFGTDYNLNYYFCVTIYMTIDIVPVDTKE